MSRAKALKRAGQPPIPNEPETPPPAPERQAVALSAYLLDTISRFELFAPRMLRIQTKAGDLVDFEMNEVQDLMEMVLQTIRNQKRRVRVVILKARRKGISTWVSGRFFWKTTTNRNRYSMIVTHEPEATDFVFKMHKRFQDNLPEWFRPTERYNNKKMLEFNNDAGTGLDSAIRVGTAAKEDFGSSQLIHYLHLSEVPKWPRHVTTNLILSLLQCVPDTDDSEIFLESTAKGVGGEFYTRYWGSRYRIEFYLGEDGKPALRETINDEASEDNIYTSVFIPWFVFSEYQKEPAPNFQRTEEEEQIARLHNLTDRHLAWRRWAIENMSRSGTYQEKLLLFNQEYPTDPMSAFISSNDNIFNVALLRDLISKCVPERANYQIQLTTGNWLYDKAGKVRVWDEPIAGRRYVVSGDVAEGITSGDFSSFDVIDGLTGKQVAHWRGHIPPDQFGKMCLYAAYRYNKALIAIERNNHGLTSIDVIQQAGYKNIYSEEVVEPPARPRRRYGWVTTKQSKPRIIDNLSAELRDGTHGIACKETLEEMMFFKQFEDGTLGAEEGQKDDRVMSYAIGKYVVLKKVVSKVAQKDNSYYTDAHKRVAAPAVSPLAWT